MNAAVETETDYVDPIVIGQLRDVVAGRLNVGGVFYDPASRTLLAEAQRVVKDGDTAQVVVRNGIATAVTVENPDVVRGVLDGIRDDAVTVGGRRLVVAARLSGDDFAEMLGRLVEARIEGRRVVTVRELVARYADEVAAAPEQKSRGLVDALEAEAARLDAMDGRR